MRAVQIGPVTETTYVNCVLSNQNISFSGCVNYCTPLPRLYQCCRLLPEIREVHPGRLR